MLPLRRGFKQNGCVYFDSNYGNGMYLMVIRDYEVLMKMRKKEGPLR